MILVTTPEPTAIMDAYALIKTMSGEYPGSRVKLVVNNADTMREAEYTMKKIIEVVSTYLKIDIERFGCVLRDPAVSKAVRGQCPLIISQPKSAAAGSIREIAEGFLETESDRPGGIRGFFKRFLGA